MIHTLLSDVVFVVRSFVLDDEGRFLMLQRSGVRNNNAGLWECPGGRMEGSQHINPELAREIYEETGYHVHPATSFAYITSRIFKDSDSHADVPYIVICGVTQISSGSLKLSDEHQDARWVTYDVMCELELTPETRKALEVLDDVLV